MGLSECGWRSAVSIECSSLALITASRETVPKVMPCAQADSFCFGFGLPALPCRTFSCRPFGSGQALQGGERILSRMVARAGGKAGRSSLAARRARTPAPSAWLRTSSQPPGRRRCCRGVEPHSMDSRRPRSHMGRARPYSASFFFTRTTVILAKPSSKVGGFSLAAMRRMTSSGTTRSRRWWRSMQTSRGTSKKMAWTSYW